MHASSGGVLTTSQGFSLDWAWLGTLRSAKCPGPLPGRELEKHPAAGLTQGAQEGATVCPECQQSLVILSSHRESSSPHPDSAQPGVRGVCCPPWLSGSTAHSTVHVSICPTADGHLRLFQPWMSESHVTTSHAQHRLSKSSLTSKRVLTLCLI